MEIEKGEKEPRPRISLYLEKEVTHKIDDMRLLMTFNGGNMDSIPEFTDMIDALILFAYAYSYPEVKEIFLKKFISEKNNEPGQFSDTEEFRSYYEIFKELEAPKYDIQTGYEAKLYNLKDPYRDLIERSITSIKKTTGLTIDYSNFIKKSIDFVFGSSAPPGLKWLFFEYIYIGSLYNFSPATSIKLGSFNGPLFKEITPLELKEIKLLNSDLKVFDELLTILGDAEAKKPEKQYDFLVNELKAKKNLLKSILWDFNYSDAFYGYTYSSMYLLVSFKSIISFIEEINFGNKVNEILKGIYEEKDDNSNIFKKQTKRKTVLMGNLEDYISTLGRFHLLAQLIFKNNVNETSDLLKIMDEIEDANNYVMRFINKNNTFST